MKENRYSFLCFVPSPSIDGMHVLLTTRGFIHWAGRASSASNDVAACGNIQGFLTAHSLENAATFYRERELESHPQL